MDLIKPKEVTIETLDKEKRTYTISRIPAIEAREIVAQYSVGALPKVGDYRTNEEMMLKMMQYVAVDINGKLTPLQTKSLVNNHVPDWESLAKLEMEIIRYNTSFFTDGKASTFFEGIAQKAQALIFKTLTDFSAQLSKNSTPPSEN